MKRISIVLGFVAALFTMVSCQKENNNFLRASISRYHGADKVHLDASNYACWDGDETIWINGVSSEYNLVPIDGDNEHFLINMGSNAPTANDAGLVLNAVFHPSTVSLGTYDSDDNTIDITLPDIQTYHEDGNRNQVIDAPMVAQATVSRYGGADVQFNNVCALLKVQLQPNVICYYIEVTSNNAPLNGTGTIDITSKTLTMPSTGTEATRKVKLIVNEEEDLSSGSTCYCRADGVYYIVLPPYMGSNLTVTVYDNPQTYMTFSQNDEGGHSLGAGEIGVINVERLDVGRGLFSVDANHTLVSFAPGNLTGTSSYSFTSSQTDYGTVYDYSENINSTYSNAMGSEWFLLSAEQWAYLLNREDASGNKLQARCSVNGQHGLMLFPDDWSTANGYPARVTDNPWSNVTNWETLRNYGAVFLPSQPGNNDNKKHYLTATPNTVVIFGQGNGLPNGGRGIVATTDRNMESTNPPIEFNSGVTIPNGCIRLAHMVEDHTNASSTTNESR